MLKQKGFTAVEGIIIIVIVGIIGFAGWTVLNRSDSDTQLSVDSSEKSELVDELPDDLSFVLPVSEIQTKAESENVDKSVSGIELEFEDGVVVYVVHFNDGSVVVYDARTGDILQVGDDNDDEIEDEDRVPAGFVAGITIQEAIDIAKQQRPSSKLRKVELEVENGMVVYSVRFTDDSRVDVNALNGAIQRLKNEDGEDERKIGDESDEDDDETDDEADDEDEEDEFEEADDEDDDEEDDSSNSGSGSSSSGRRD